jgi:hypothetical protein
MAFRVANMTERGTVLQEDVEKGSCALVTVDVCVRDESLPASKRHDERGRVRRISPELELVTLRKIRRPRVAQ